jgi:hypothetical protein
MVLYIVAAVIVIALKVETRAHSRIPGNS